MINNPYNPGIPVNPRYYANQNSLLSTFRVNVNAVTKSGGITQPENFAIIGPWGMGKTSTLCKFEYILQNEFQDTQTFSSFVALKPANCEDPDTFCACILENLFKVYKTTMPLPKQVLDFIKDELIILDAWKLSRLSVNSPEFVRAGQKVTAINFTETMLRFWDKLNDSDIKIVVIMIDDIHYVMLKEQGDIFYNLRTDIQTLGMAGVPFMFIISTSDILYPIIQDFAEPFTRLFDRNELSLFPIDGTMEQIRKPLEIESIPLRISQNVIEKIHEITRGHPYFVTLIMRELLFRLPADCTVIDDFDRYIPDALEILAVKKFDADFASTTDAEKEVLFKVAALREDEFMPKDVGGKTTVTLLDRLIKKKLIVKTGYGKYRFYTHLFGEYLLSQKVRFDRGN
ncbi:MAG: hypothetical protein PHF57_11035 [Methanoregula sp.]|nr:hypothetical protein [Methanoregula sp.]